MKKIIDVEVIPLKKIETLNGNVFHALKNSDKEYISFGEAYFSSIKHNSIKGWKRHKLMQLNIIVNVGLIRFIMHDDRKNSPTFGCYQEVFLSLENYCRLTIPPMVWFAFQGMAKTESILLNIASIPHNTKEVETQPLEKFNFHW